MDKELAIFLICVGTPILVIITNLLLIRITKRRFKVANPSREIIKSTFSNLRDPWKEENKGFEKLSIMVKAIKDKEESELETKDL